MEFISGKISSDAFLASLYEKDEQVEVDEYVARYFNKTELKEIELLIKALPINVLVDRLLKHACLTKEFRHFQILRFEPYAESEELDLAAVPFLLSKTANLKRYGAGK